MAEGKKSFILYCDLIHTVKKMPDDKAGQLFKHILSYVNDENPITDDLIVDLTFEPIKRQLKRDLQKFEDSKESKSNGGRLGNLKRWNTDLYENVMLKKITLDEAEKIALSRKVSHTDSKESLPIAQIAVNDNVNVTVNDNVNDNVINNINYNHQLISVKDAFDEFWILYDKKIDKSKCELKFSKLKKEEIENILNVVKNYVISTPDVKYRKNPLTWLNRECWNDEIQTESKNQELTFEQKKEINRNSMAF